MPYHFSVVVITAIGAWLSSVLLAADEGTFFDAAERWGLWAALTLVLIGSMIYGLYRIVNFQTNTLVGLIESDIYLKAQMIDAIRNAPCGKEIDSDEIGKTPPDGARKAIDRVKRRRERENERDER